ncbi:MAG: hypothetical protein ACE15C_14640 [Phycisphaerae bacterium]
MEIAEYILVDASGQPWRGYNGRLLVIEGQAEARELAAHFSTKARPLAPVRGRFLLAMGPDGEPVIGTREELTTKGTTGTKLIEAARAAGGEPMAKAMGAAIDKVSEAFGGGRPGSPRSRAAAFLAGNKWNGRRTSARRTERNI